MSEKRKRKTEWVSREELRILKVNRETARRGNKNKERGESEKGK